MVDFEEMTDIDGFISIQMKKNELIEIMDYFNPFIMNMTNKKEEGVFNFGGVKTVITLSIYNKEFGMYGRRYEVGCDPLGSYMRDFEIQECSIEDWDEIYNFVKQ